MKRVFEINPLKCSRLSKTLGKSKKIADHLGLVTWRAPPPFAAKSAGAVSAPGRRLDSSSEFAQVQ